MKFYHGTTNISNALDILKNGFSLKNSGYRQIALYGKTDEIPGVYLTDNSLKAEWYASSDLAVPGMGDGVVIEVLINGEILPEKEWWKLLRTHKKEKALYILKEKGFIGFQENYEEFVILDPKNVKPTGGYVKKPWGKESINNLLEEHGATAPLNNYPGNYLSTPKPDGNKGRGYGKLDGDAKYTPISADGFPYDLHVPPEGENPEDEFEDPLMQKKFAGNIGSYAGSKPDYVSRSKDPFSFFDDNTVGLTGLSEEILREYIKLIIEPIIGESSMIRLRPRSSEPDGATTQWGTKIPGGTQFGWSSAYPFPQKKDQYEPVFSLSDLMTKHEDKWDRTHGELEPEPEEDWKKEYGEEQHAKKYPLFWE